ncbi:GTPase-interacting component 2 [Lachancea thermotolerans]
MALQVNLPQMKSIWIDEDQEAEKLYGLQAQHLMDSDGEDHVDVVLINSNKPLLNNKEKIELPPLIPAAYKPSHNKKQPLNKMHGSSTLKSKKKTGKLFSLFKMKETRGSSSHAKISVPYNFQHISHADLKNVFEGEELACDVEASPALLNKAFVTESAPSQQPLQARQRSAGSSLSALRRSSSIASSQYSSRSARIVSTSTMATSVGGDDSCRSLKKLDHLEKMHLKHRYNKSDASSVSVEFLKNYDFPTVLEDSLVEIKTPEMCSKQHDKFTWESPADTGALLETMIQAKCPMPPSASSRRKSDSQLVFSPISEQRASFLDTPRTRKSVDEVLLCYHQQSENSSELQEPSEFSFSQRSSAANRNSVWDKDTETFEV